MSVSNADETFQWNRINPQFNYFNLYDALSNILEKIGRINTDVEGILKDVISVSLMLVLD